MSAALSSASPSAVPTAHTARRALWPTMAQFFMNGVTFATWGVQIPVIKSLFQVDDATMSLAMLCVAGGAVVSMKHVGAWVSRVGSARALTTTSFVYAATLLAIPLAPVFPALLAVLAVFGMAMAAFDVAMNVQAANIETAGGRPVMSSMHGMFSVGGMAGAALGALLIALHLPATVHAAIVALLLMGTAVYASRRLLPDLPDLPDSDTAIDTAIDTMPADDGASPTASTRPIKPSRRVPKALLTLGTVAFLGLVCEGAMYDWAAVYMRDVANASLQQSGYGYAVFSMGMAVGRFSADFLRRRVCVQRLLSASAWLGFAGIVLAIALPSPLASLVGFALMGLGVANFMPFFFLAGTRLPGMSAADGVAGVARFAYAGMLFGPPIIGALAHTTTLRTGLGVIAVVMGAIASFGIRKVYRGDAADQRANNARVTAGIS